jgi:hypothetical protein
MYDRDSVTKARVPVLSSIPLLGGLFFTRSADAGKNPNPETLEEESSASARLKLRELLGRTGIAESMLRPAGKVRLDSGELLDVVTDGVYVEAGKRVTVIEAAPNRVVVAAKREAAATGEEDGRSGG